MDAGGAFAAYITGNVASNLIGRLMSAGVADHLGLAANFYFFSALNLAGAVLVYFTIRAHAADADDGRARRSPLADLDAASAQSAAARRLRDRLLHPVRVHRHVHLRELRAGRARRSRSARWRWASSISSSCRRSSPRRSPAASCSVRHAAHVLGVRLALAGARLALAADRTSPAVLVGLALVGVGTFFAQAVATGFVGRAATERPGAASGIYLACYFSGGLVGSAVLGQLFDRFGWSACVAGIGLSLAVAAALAVKLRLIHRGGCIAPLHRNQSKSVFYRAPRISHSPGRSETQGASHVCQHSAHILSRSSSPSP